MSLNDWVIKQFLKQNIMLKNILKLNGAQQLSKNEQKEVNGGITVACAQAQANGCTPPIAPGVCNPGDFYNRTCRCCQ